MNDKDKFLKDLNDLAIRYSLTRIKTESINFKREFQLIETGKLVLVSEKAIITALGKTSVVPIGENQKYKSYEEAEKYVREFWSKYFKERRERRSDKEKLAEARRQKRYREKRKQAITQLKRQQ